MRTFRVVEIHPNKNIFYLQEKKYFLIWHYWKYVKELKVYYDSDDWEIMTFHSVEQAEAYVAQITTIVVEPELKVVKIINA